MPRAKRRRRNPAPESASLRHLGERIRAARAERGLSQTALGSPHFTRAYVSAVELGKIRPSMRSLEFLVERLGVSAAALLEGEAPAEREFTRLRAEAAALARETLEPLSRARAIELANGPADLAALADREVARAEARFRAGESALAITQLRAAITLRAAARELALLARARRVLATAPR